MAAVENYGVLGWREWLALPTLGISRIKAKVDTGARTSTLHAFKLETFERSGQPWVRFHIHPEQGDSSPVHIGEAAIVDQRSVRDSGGHQELRYIIETDIQIGARLHRIEMTLTDRENMRFRMLLGRTAIRGHYLVDSAASYLSSPPPQGTQPGES